MCVVILFPFLISLIYSNIICIEIDGISFLLYDSKTKCEGTFYFFLFALYFISFCSGIFINYKLPSKYKVFLSCSYSKFNNLVFYIDFFVKIILIHINRSFFYKNKTSFDYFRTILLFFYSNFR